MKKVLIILLILIFATTGAMATTQHPHNYGQEEAASQEMLNPSVVIRLAEVREWIIKKFPGYHDIYDTEAEIEWKVSDKGWYIYLRNGGVLSDDMFVLLSWDGRLVIFKNEKMFFRGAWYPKFTLPTR